MKRRTKRQFASSLSGRALFMGLLLVSAISQMGVATATVITVNNAGDVPTPGGCSLRQAIVSHNEKAYVFPSTCAVGDGDDTIEFNLPFGGTIVDIGSPLNPITSGKLLINGKASGNPLSKRGINLRQAAYMTVRKGAKLRLLDMGIVVNGAEPRSVIDNDGGTLEIDCDASFTCIFSNQQGKERKPTVGGVLHNRNGGFARIDATFEKSSARDKGGAVYVDSGTVEIRINQIRGSRSVFNGNTSHQGGAIYVNSGALNVDGGSALKNNGANQGGAIYVNGGKVTIEHGVPGGKTNVNFNNNTAAQGGAIFVNGGATLKINSSNFSINHNVATNAGGAIYSNGGTVTVQRDPSQKLLSVQIASNAAGNGGGIYANGGQLSVDGIQFLANSTIGSGGAIYLSDFSAQSGASVTRTYFRENSAAVNGASIYAANVSTLNLSGDTFLRNKDGIYFNSLGTLNILNSTFLGGISAPEGIDLVTGIANVTFSSVVLADIGGPNSGFFLSNSLLREVSCSDVIDDMYNLLQQSPTCPSTIPAEKDLGLNPALLQDNGGYTPTISLVTGSPAIGAIPIGNCVDLSDHEVTIDQRDAVRPAPSDPSYCSIGAYEFGSPAIPGQIPPGTPF